MRQTSQSGSGRWQARLVHPANIVTFDDFDATSEQDAINQAQEKYPGYEVEWVVHEPNRFGVWRPPHLP